MNKLNVFSKYEIRDIAKEYANSCMSRSDFCEKYFISSTTFYNILDKAIVEHMVSYETAIKMQNKALYNKSVRLKSKKGAQTTKQHYTNLLEKRRNFIFTKSERFKILKEFSKRDLRESKAAFCEAHFFDIELLEKILIFSIVYGELPKKTYSKIKENSLMSFSNSDEVNNFFNLLEKLKSDVKSGKTFGVHELYKKVYNLLYLKSSISTSPENQTATQKTNCLNDDGDIVDDGYSIFDD